MYIKEINIENFKCFKGKFNLELNEGLNILVGDNEAGKSTILEAIHLALTGWLNGRYLKNELTQYLFNNDVIEDYLFKANGENKQTAILPHIVIEVFIAGDDFPEFEGDGNTKGKKECCISLKIAFADKYQSAYAELVKVGGVKSIPIEYYEIDWKSCARGNITSSVSIPIKSDLIDSSNHRYINGSDICISHIVRNFLNDEETVAISQAHRKMKEVFMDDGSVKKINTKIEAATSISNKKVRLSVELSSKNAWESSLVTYMDDVPFHQIGKGEQCIVKTKLALCQERAKKANVLLLEEPENHLSHAKLNQLISGIKDCHAAKQLIISTHSSFVANKLGLEYLILLNVDGLTKKREKMRLNDLSSKTKIFFEKLSGYDTLRMILCRKAILVEGDSDELIIQKAYLTNNDGKLPICQGVDVISVGTAFLRFLEIAEKIRKPVVVVTDNDGDVEIVKDKYSNYLDNNKKDFITICFDETVDLGDLIIGSKRFNYNTLEPKLLKENSVDIFNSIFDTHCTTIDDMHRYMKANKTECALKIFNTQNGVNFPKYILDSIK